MKYTSAAVNAGSFLFIPGSQFRIWELWVPVVGILGSFSSHCGMCACRLLLLNPKPPPSPTDHVSQSWGKNTATTDYLNPHSSLHWAKLPGILEITAYTGLGWEISLGFSSSVTYKLSSSTRCLHVPSSVPFSPLPCFGSTHLLRCQVQQQQRSLWAPRHQEGCMYGDQVPHWKATAQRPRGMPFVSDFPPTYNRSTALPNAPKKDSWCTDISRCLPGNERSIKGPSWRHKMEITSPNHVCLTEVEWWISKKAWRISAPCELSLPQNNPCQPKHTFL